MKLASLFKGPLPGLGGGPINKAPEPMTMAKDFCATASSEGMFIDLLFAFAKGDQIMVSIAIQDLSRFAGELARATADFEKIIAKRSSEIEALAATVKEMK